MVTHRDDHRVYKRRTQNLEVKEIQTISGGAECSGLLVELAMLKK